MNLQSRCPHLQTHEIQQYHSPIVTCQQPTQVMKHVVISNATRFALAALALQPQYGLVHCFESRLFVKHRHYRPCFSKI